MSCVSPYIILVNPLLFYPALFVPFCVSFVSSQNCFVTILCDNNFCESVKCSQCSRVLHRWLQCPNLRFSLTISKQTLVNMSTEVLKGIMSSLAKGNKAVFEPGTPKVTPNGHRAKKEKLRETMRVMVRPTLISRDLYPSSPVWPHSDSNPFQMDEINHVQHSNSI